MMHTEREFRAEEALRALLTNDQWQLYKTSPSFRAEVQELIRFVIPTMLRGIEAQAVEHDEAKRKTIATISAMMQPMQVNLGNLKL